MESIIFIKTLLKQTTLKASLQLKQTINKLINNMESQTVNFNLHAYRQLLNEKVKSLQQLEQLYDSQNKPVVDKLLEEKILSIVNNQIVPSGIIVSPADGKEYTAEESSHNQNILTKVTAIFNEYGGKTAVNIDLEELNTMLCFEITPMDIAKCLV